MFHIGRDIDALAMCRESAGGGCSAGWYRYRCGVRQHCNNHNRRESCSAYLDLGNVSHGLTCCVGSRPMDLTFFFFLVF